MQLERLAPALGPFDVVNAAPVEISDLAYDTHAVTPGTLFFCVRGTRADGHDLAADAVARGAVALVVEGPLELAVPQIVVPDSRRAMAPAAVAFFGDPSHELDVTAVTGTAGKTTTTYLLYEILRAAGRRPGLLTNMERRVGNDTRPAELNTPEAIDLQRLFREMVDAGNRACAMEATSHASAQGRLDGVRFAVLVFTNLAHDHLDFHGSMESYFEAKRRLFAQAEHAVVNVGNGWGRRLADGPRQPDHVRRGRRQSGCRPEAARTLQRRERARCSGCSTRARHRRGRDPRGDRSRAGRARTFRARGRRPAVHRRRRLLAQAGIARARAAGSAWSRAGPCHLRVRLRRRPRPREAAGHGPDRLDARRRGRRNVRQSAQRGSAGDHRRDRRGAPELEVEPDRRTAIARAIEVGARRRRRADRRQGHEQGQEIGGTCSSRSTIERSRASCCARCSPRDPARTRHRSRTWPRVSSTAPGGRTRSQAYRSTRAGSTKATCSSRSATAPTIESMRSPAGLRRRSSPTIHSQRSPRSPAPFATGATRASSRSRARWARPRRRTFSPRSAPHRRGRSRRSAATTTRSACRSPSAASRPDTEICILELSMRGFGQIAELCAFTRPHIGVITNIAPVHLEKVGNLEGVVRAKRELIDALPPRRDRRRSGGLRRCAAPTSTSSASARTCTSNRSSRRCSARRIGTAEVNFSAQHLAVNAVIAFATAHALGLEIPERIDVTFAEWRNQELPLPAAGCCINDAWNANPISMRAALEHLRQPRRRTAAASPSSARWPSSATTPTRRTARSRRSRGDRRGRAHRGRRARERLRRPLGCKRRRGDRRSCARS